MEIFCIRNNKKREMIGLPFGALTQSWEKEQIDKRDKMCKINATYLQLGDYTRYITKVTVTTYRKNSNQ